MKKIGRNDPCHCGSGKKFKNCHEKLGSSPKTRNKDYVIGGIVLLFIIFGIAMMFFKSDSSGKGAPGPAPKGKVWSEAHGHWHDA